MREDDQRPVEDDLREEDPLEATLRQLQPAEPQVDRDELMYRAGYAAGVEHRREKTTRRSSLSIWQASTGLMTAATITLAVMLARQPDGATAIDLANVDRMSAPVEIDDQEPLQAPDPELPPLAPVEVAEPLSPLLVVAPSGDPSSNYLALRAAVLLRGVDAWPDFTDRQPSTRRASDPVPTRTMLNMRNELLRSPTPSQPPDDSPPAATVPEAIHTTPTDEETLA
ncbi:hypothetical protein [Aeoliella mucimassa]|uniref:Uncharacterized protein n=1 Tax=Aeoliella mucimassa TaxID=2527972 RepID=A0A518AVM6_9BACT|nr:hypothetical protein [Aeoliella mucimassa]QDU58789.1 hypothetical protein Pan181_50290 [Aeoliella mucimassa]